MSQAAWFVTGTDTEIGKTVVTCALLHALAQAGVQAAGLKPVAAGAFERDGQLHNEDCDLIMAASTCSLPQQVVTPWLLREPMAPHVAAAREGREITLAPIVASYTQAMQQAQAVVMEGVGGIPRAAVLALRHR